MRVRLKHRISRPVLPSPPRAGRKSIEEQLLLIKQGIYYYRDGDVVLYRRPGIQVWQCRFRLLDGTWQRQTTGHRNRVADHINPIKDGGERFDWANLQGLCISCHNRKTAGETARARVPNLLVGGLRVKANA